MIPFSLMFPIKSKAFPHLPFQEVGRSDVSIHFMRSVRKERYGWLDPRLIEQIITLFEVAPQADFIFILAVFG
jgi:hypothetical protein